MFLLRRSRSAIVLATGLIAMVSSAVAQRGVTTLGLQVKPVIALDYFDRNTAEEIDHVRYTMNLQGGIAFGMNVRVGVTNMISFETGIGQIQRRYSFRIVNDTSGFDATGTMKYVGYEMPIMGLVFIRLGERAWMNTALGASMDFYPSDAEGFMADAAGRARIFRKNWAQGGVIGNIGVEYRTYKSGTFYLGATYHRPFNDMAVADMTWTYRGPPAISTHTVRTTLNGSYLTVDLRYYFHEDPARRKAPRTK